MWGINSGVLRDVIAHPTHTYQKLLASQVAIDIYAYLIPSSYTHMQSLRAELSRNQLMILRITKKRRDHSRNNHFSSFQHILRIALSKSHQLILREVLWLMGITLQDHYGRSNRLHLWRTDRSFHYIHHYNIFRILNKTWKQCTMSVLWRASKEVIRSTRNQRGMSS